MAHEILVEDGKASMFYVGGVPWHGLGTRLERPPSTAAAAMKAANLDWQVIKVPLYGAAGTRLVAVPEANAVVRVDRWGSEKCDVFGVVGDGYTPVQNLDAFEFFDPLIKNGDAAYHTAGALGRGERVWVLAEMKGEFEVGPGDKVRRYVLLSNSHDGRSSLHLKFTPVLTIRALDMALKRRDTDGYRLGHAEARSGRRELEGERF